MAVTAYGDMGDGVGDVDVVVVPVVGAAVATGKMDDEDDAI